MSNENNDSIYFDEFRPLSEELMAVGIIGIVLYFIVLFCALYSSMHRSKSMEMKYFYASLGFLACFEFPRYFSMAITGKYDCVLCYAFHIVANFLYFTCLALVAVTFARILELGSYVSLMYSKRGIFFAVAFQGVIDFAAFIICLQKNSLFLFFNSDLYQAFVMFDMFQNVLYSVVLSFYGLRLIFRF
jgi:hypothetical protein